MTFVYYTCSYALLIEVVKIKNVHASVKGMCLVAQKFFNEKSN